MKGEKEEREKSGLKLTRTQGDEDHKMSHESLTCQFETLLGRCPGEPSHQVF